MRKHSWLIAFAMVLIVLFSACNPETPANNGPGTVKILINPSSDTRSLESNVSLVTEKYRIEINPEIEGTGDPVIVDVNKDETIKTMILNPGNWKITVYALNNTGKAIGSGTSPVTVNSGALSECSVIVREYDGQGTLSIRISGLNPLLDLTATLSNSLEDSNPVEYKLDKIGSTYYGSKLVEHGSYLLNINLNGGTIWSEAIGVVANGQTNADVRFLENGKLEIGTAPDMDSFTVTSNIENGVVTNGSTYTFNSTVPAKWFIDGVLQSAEPSTEFSWTVTGLNGGDSRKISAVVDNGSFARAFSIVAGVAFDNIKPVVVLGLNGDPILDQTFPLRVNNWIDGYEYTLLYGDSLESSKVLNKNWNGFSAKLLGYGLKTMYVEARRGDEVHRSEPIVVNVIEGVRFAVYCSDPVTRQNAAMATISSKTPLENVTYEWYFGNIGSTSMVKVEGGKEIVIPTDIGLSTPVLHGKVVVKNNGIEVFSREMDFNVQLTNSANPEVVNLPSSGELVVAYSARSPYIDSNNVTYEWELAPGQTTSGMEFNLRLTTNDIGLVRYAVNIRDNNNPEIKNRAQVYMKVTQDAVIPSDTVTLSAWGRPLPDRMSLTRLGNTISLSINGYDAATTYKVYYDDVESSKFTHTDGTFRIYSLDLDPGTHTFRVDGVKDGKTVTGKTYTLVMENGMKLSPFHPVVRDDGKIELKAEPIDSKTVIPAGGKYTWKIWNVSSADKPAVEITQDSNTYIWTPATPRTDGRFVFKVDYVNGEYTATTTECTYYFLPRFNMEKPAEIRAGEIVKLAITDTLSMVDPNAYVYEWKVNGTVVEGVNGPEASVQVPKEGNNTVTISYNAKSDRYANKETMNYEFTALPAAPDTKPTYSAFNTAWTLSGGDLSKLPATPHYYEMTADEYNNFLSDAGRMASLFSLENSIFSYYTAEGSSNVIIHQSAAGWSGEPIMPNPDTVIEDTYMDTLSSAFPLNAVWYNRLPYNAGEIDRSITAAYENMVSVDSDQKDIADAHAKMVVDWLYANTPAVADRNGDGIIGYVLMIGDSKHAVSIARTDAIRKAFSIPEGNTEGSIVVGGKTMKVKELASKEMLGSDGSTWNAETSSATMTEWLATFGDQIDLVISNNDGMLYAATQVAGYPADIHSFGADGNVNVVEAIKAGRITGTIYAEPEIQAVASLMLLRNRMSGLTGNDAWKTGINKPDDNGNMLLGNFRFDSVNRILYVLPVEISKANADIYLSPERNFGINNSYSDSKKVMITVYNSGDNYLNQFFVPTFKKYGQKLGMDLTFVVGTGYEDQMILDGMKNLGLYDGILLNPARTVSACKYVAHISEEMSKSLLTFKNWFDMVSGCLFGTSTERPGTKPNFTRITAEELTAFDRDMKAAMASNKDIEPVRCLVEPETGDFSVEFDMFKTSRYVVNQRTDGTWYGYIRTHENNGDEVFCTMDLSGSSRTAVYDAYWNKLPAAIQNGPVLVEIEIVTNPDSNPDPERGVRLVLHGGTDAKAEARRYADILGAGWTGHMYEKRDGKFVYSVYDYANTVCIDVCDFVYLGPDPRYGFNALMKQSNDARQGIGKMPSLLFMNMSDEELVIYKSEMRDYWNKEAHGARVEVDAIRNADGFKSMQRITYGDDYQYDELVQDSKGNWTENITGTMDGEVLTGRMQYEKPAKSIVLDLPSALEVSAYGKGQMGSSVQEMVTFYNISAEDVRQILERYSLEPDDPLAGYYGGGDMNINGFMLNAYVVDNGHGGYGVTLNYTGDGKPIPAKPDFSHVSINLKINDSIEPLAGDTWLNATSYSINAIGTTENLEEKIVTDISKPIVLLNLKAGDLYEITVNAINADGSIIGTGKTSVRKGDRSAEIVVKELVGNGNISVVLKGFSPDAAPTVKYGQTSVEMRLESGVWKGLLAVHAGKERLVVETPDFNRTLGVRVVSGRTTDVVVFKENGTSGIIVENNITKTPEIVISELQAYDPASRTFKLSAAVPGYPEAEFTWKLNGVVQKGKETIWQIPPSDYTGYLYVNVFTKCGDLFVSNSYELKI